MTRIGRRAALAALAGAAPFAARGQEPAPVPQTAPLAIPQTTPPAAPVPAPARPAAGPAGGIDHTKAYYVYFEQNIDVASMRTLKRQLAALVEAGVTQITLVISSAGGLIEPTLNAYGFIRSLPATINTHAESFVQSAATVLFLAGAERTADRHATFLFHPSTTNLLGAMNEQQVQERLTQVDTVQGLLAAIYRDRTRLSDEQIGRFAHSEVILSAQQAQEAGIVQTVSDLKIQGGQTAKVLFLE